MFLRLPCQRDAGSLSRAEVNCSKLPAAAYVAQGWHLEREQGGSPSFWRPQVGDHADAQAADGCDELQWHRHHMHFPLLPFLHRLRLPSCTLHHAVSKRNKLPEGCHQRGRPRHTNMDSKQADEHYIALAGQT